MTVAYAISRRRLPCAVERIGEDGRHSNDVDRGDLRDDKRAEMFADESNRQFGAKNELAISTLPTSFGGTISQMREWAVAVP